MRLSDGELDFEVSTRLQKWYLENVGNNKFPWRASIDPYKSLIAELLLQRTRGEMVRELYSEFIQTFPTPLHIVESGIAKLREYFEKIGLGYRATRLYQISEILVNRYGGQVPCSFRELLTLPGIGVYIASAVMNFGCGKPTPVVDVNVMRVLNRIYGIYRETYARAKIWQFYMNADHKIIGYSLIDLGREVCIPVPNCKVCPLNDICPRKYISPQWWMLRKVIRGKKVFLREQPVKTLKKSKGKT